MWAVFLIASQKEVYEGMKKWKEEEGKLIVMTTQVVSEGSNMTVYEVGKKVKQDFDFWRHTI